MKLCYVKQFLNYVSLQGRRNRFGRPGKCRTKISIIQPTITIQLCLRNVYAQVLANCWSSNKLSVYCFMIVFSKLIAFLMQELCQNNRLHIKFIYASISATHVNNCSLSHFHIAQLSVLLTVQLFASLLVIVFKYSQLRTCAMCSYNYSYVATYNYSQLPIANQLLQLHTYIVSYTVINYSYVTKQLANQLYVIS